MFFHLKPGFLMTFYLKQLLQIESHDSMAFLSAALFLESNFLE